MTLRKYVTDITDYCTIPPALSDIVQSIHTIYLYDPSRAIHLCELTASYELHYVRTYCILTSAYDYNNRSDVLGNFESDIQTDDEPLYVHCRQVDKHSVEWDRLDLSSDPDEYEDEIKRAIEYERNHAD